MSSTEHYIDSLGEVMEKEKALIGVSITGSIALLASGMAAEVIQNGATVASNVLYDAGAAGFVISTGYIGVKSIVEWRQNR